MSESLVDMVKLTKIAHQKLEARHKLVLLCTHLSPKSDDPGASLPSLGFFSFVQGLHFSALTWNILAKEACPISISRRLRVACLFLSIIRLSLAFSSIQSSCCSQLSGKGNQKSLVGSGEVIPFPCSVSTQKYVTTSSSASHIGWK